MKAVRRAVQIVESAVQIPKGLENALLVTSTSSAVPRVSLKASSIELAVLDVLAEFPPRIMW